VTEQERIAAALAYQQAQQPAMMNPNLARQGARGRENMMPPTSVMDERYPAFKRNQEDVEKLMLGLDIVGSTIPLAGPAAKGAVALGKYAAPQIAQGLENYAFKTGMALPMDVWHGTPHRFSPTAKNPLGEFNANKIGTGEGNQAYGYGHYLAEQKDVAKSYANDVAGIAGARGSRAKPAPEESIATDVENFLGDDIGEHAASRAEKIYSRSGQIIYEFDDGSLGVLNNAGRYKAFAKPEGSLYKVDLPDEVVPRMLDFDKHLAEQSPQVQKILSDYQKQLGTSFGRGDQVLKEIAFDRRMKGLDDSPAAVAKQLKELGIPGIQYLDEASRGAGTGTRNFVVFPGNEGLLNILGRE